MTEFQSYDLRHGSVPLDPVLQVNRCIEPIPKAPASLEKKANFHLFSREYKLAIECFVNAIKAYGENKKNIANCYFGIAQAYFKMNDFDKAEIVYNKVLYILKEAPDENLKFDVLTELSEVYMCKANYQKAEKLLNYQINERQFSSLDNDIQIVKKCLSRLFELYNRMGKSNEANLVMKKSAELNRVHFGMAL